MCNIKWNWKESIARWTKEKIFDDLQKDESTIFTMAKDDVARILQKTNYKFVVQGLDFDEIYKMGVDTTIKQIKKSIRKNTDFMNIEEHLELIQKIVFRIVNNIKNLFDERYKNNIRVYQAWDVNDDYAGAFNHNDALSILIQEEDDKELDRKIDALDRNYIENILESVKIDKSNQMRFEF